MRHEYSMITSRLPLQNVRNARYVLIVLFAVLSLVAYLLFSKQLQRHAWIVEDDQQQQEQHEQQHQHEQQQHQHQENPMRWFDKDGPGLDPFDDEEVRSSIWQYELSKKTWTNRSKWEKSKPQLVFVKGVKVGGTSVALALNNAAIAYNIDLIPPDKIGNVFNPPEPRDIPAVCANHSFSMFFHHGYRQPYQSSCIQDARFVTVLRNPISQALSWYVMDINHLYYRNYPPNPCKTVRSLKFPALMYKSKSYQELHDMLNVTAHCHYEPYRKNITIAMIAHTIESLNESSLPKSISATYAWIRGQEKPEFTTSQQWIDFLSQNYFVVGVTDKLNEFLVILALHLGWSLDHMYYLYCKPTDMDIHEDEFRSLFPHLHEKLSLLLQVHTETYQFFFSEWNSHVENMGSWFRNLLGEFSRGLISYRKQNHREKPDYKWDMIRFKDGSVADC